MDCNLHSLFLQKEITDEVLQTKICPAFENIENDVKDKRIEFLTGNVRNTLSGRERNNFEALISYLSFCRSKMRIVHAQPQWVTTVGEVYTVHCDLHHACLWIFLFSFEKLISAIELHWDPSFFWDFICFILQSLTYIDICFMHIAHNLDSIDPAAMNKYPTMKSIAKRIEQRPKIKK